MSERPKTARGHYHVEELKKTTQDLQGPNVINMVVPSSTILALIEVAEAAQKLAAIDDIPEHGCDDDLSLNCAETGAPISFMSSEDFRRLRTALEGVKK